MSIFPIEFSKTSEDGINSYGATSGALWSGNTFTGAGELNNFAYLGANLQTDEAGTLTFEFSQDGINWSKYPVTEFTIASGINEVHTAWKGGRYVRPKFTGSNGARTYFRLQTYYSNHPLPLSSPLNQSVNADQDATIVRSVGIGEKPDGTFVNDPNSGYAFSTGATLAAGGTYSTGWIQIENYQQISTQIVSNVDGTMKFEFATGATDSSIVRTINIAYAASSGFQLLSAPCFTSYVKYSYTNGATAQSSFLYDTKLLTGALSGQVLPLNSNIASGMVANLGRNVIVGQEPSGSYTNQKQDGTAFVTGATLGVGATYASSLVSTSGYSQIETRIFSNVSGTLTGRWYNDASKTTLIRTFSRPYSGDEIGTISYFSSPVFGPYAEYQYVNGATAQSEFYLEFIPRTKSISGQVLGMNDFIPPGVVANLGRNVIVGQSDGGDFINVPVDTKGHLEVAIHGPLNPFGSIHTEKLTPVFQTDPVYGINEGQVKTTIGLGGTATTLNSKFRVGTGTTIGGQGVIQSRRRLRYRPGQGILSRFTAKYTTPVANSYQLAGLGHGEDGVYFGYGDTNNLSNTEFGILYVKFGVREIQTLTINTASSTTENVNVVLSGATASVPVTNSANIQRTVWEISTFDYAGWAAYASGNTVVFVSNSSGNKTGTFSLSGTSVAGTFSETRAGVASTDVFIPQSQWNGDKLDGTGRSGVTLDKTKGNVYQIGIQHLGFGPIEFFVEVTSGGKNTWVTCHTINNPNSNTEANFSNPSFPFTLATYSAGSSTNLRVESGSFAGFIEGDIESRGNRFVYQRGVAATVGTTLYHALGTIMNKLSYRGKSSQVVINIKEFSGHIEDGQSAGTIYLIRNGSLVGNPNFADYSSTSATSWDTAATSVTFTDNNQVVAAIPLGLNGQGNREYEDSNITLQPGEWLTMAAKADTTILDYCSIVLTTREDQ